MSTTLHHNTHKAIVTTYLAMIVSSLVGFLLPIILVKNLSIEEFGSYKMVQSLQMVCGVLTSFGLQAVIGRYLPELIIEKKYKHGNKLFLISLLIRFIAVLLCVIILYYLSDIIFPYFNFPPIIKEYYWIISIIISTMLTKTILGPAYLSALMEQHISNFNTVVYFILLLSLSTFFLFLGFALKGVLIAWLLAELISFLHFAWVATGKYKKYANKKDDVSSIFDIKRFVRCGSFHLLAGNIAVFHSVLIDNFVIAKYTTIELVGIYGLASFISELSNRLDPLLTLKGVFYTVIVGKYTENKDLNLVHKSYNFINKTSLFLYIPSSVGIFLISDKLIQYIIKSNYSEATEVLYILVPFFIFMPLSRGVSVIANLLEHNQIMLLAGISSGYNLVMDIVLIRYFGIKGVAFATGSAMMLLYIMYFFALQRYIKLSFPLKTITTIFMNTVPMIIFLYYVKGFITGVFSFIGIVIISMFLYFLMAFFNKVFNEEERSVINRALKRRVWVF